MSSIDRVLKVILSHRVIFTHKKNKKQLISKNKESK